MKIKLALMHILIASLLTSCGTGNFLKLGAIAEPIVVAPAFSTAPDWNDYIANTNKLEPWTNPDTVCASSSTHFNDCTHAGVFRKVALPSWFKTCTGLTYSDTLDYFDWTCVENSGRVTLLTKGLKSGLTLRNLIDSATLGWKKNSVVVTGYEDAETELASWWPNNPVLELPDNSGAADTPAPLNTSKAVYVLTADRLTRGYNIGADKISIVTLNNAKLTYNGTAVDNCNSANGSQTSPDQKTLLCGAGRKNLWVEAHLNGHGAGLSIGVYIRDSSYNHFSNLLLQGLGLELNNVDGSRISSMRGSWSYIVFRSAEGNLASKLQVMNGSIVIYGGSRNTIDQFITSNNYNGILVESSEYNSFSRGTIFGNEGAGMTIQNGGVQKNLFSFITVANSKTSGIGYWNGSKNTFHNLVILNSNEHGTNGGGQGFYSHLLVGDNQYQGLAFYAANNMYSGHYVGGSVGGGCVTSGVAKGIDNSCVGTDLSTGLLTYNTFTTASAEIIGKVVTEDDNTSDTLGAVAGYPGSSLSTFDYINFTNPFNEYSFNPYRAWGIDGGAYPSSNHRTSWQNSPISGRIWDLSLRSTGTTLLNRTDTVTSPNPALSQGAACPAWLSGNRIIRDYSEGETAGDGMGDDDGICEVGEACTGRTFLANAFEVIDDGIGNDNGVCESNETCVAAPNFGGYQGHGGYSANSCVFQDGTVTGVTMKFFSQNGL